MVLKILHRHVFAAYIPQGRKADIRERLECWYRHYSRPFPWGRFLLEFRGEEANVLLNSATDHTFKIDIMNYLCFVSFL